MASLLNTIIVYAAAILPIVVWWLICTKIKDYGVLMVLEIIICHILVPNILRNVLSGIYSYNLGTYYKFEFRNTGGQAGGIVVIYLIGYLLISFWSSSKHWNFSQKSLMFPSWKSNVGIIIYAIIVALIALFVFPVSEHYFYSYFILWNVQGWGFGTLAIISLLNSAKYYFLFTETVSDKNAGLFWTILWVIMYLVIDLSRGTNYHYKKGNHHYWFWGGLGLKQVVMLLYSITMVLWSLGIQFPKPNNVQKTRSDNKLSSLF